VSGGVAGATKGTLAVMASGPSEAFARVAPLLRIFGKVFAVGDRPGQGQAMKLANNLLSAAALAISSEVMVMGVKSGLDPKLMIDVINASTGRNTATETKFPISILTRRFAYGFTTGLMHKDVRLYLEEAEALATRVVVLAKGRVIASGSVDDMRSLVARRQISCESSLTPEIVRAWPGVADASRDRNRLLITATDAEGVVRRLLATDPDLRRLDVREAGLADAFNELTREAA